MPRFAANAVAILTVAIAWRHRHIATQGDILLRAKTWWKLVNEFDDMKAVYEDHVREKFFVWGAPAESFDKVDAHPACA